MSRGMVVVLSPLIVGIGFGESRYELRMPPVVAARPAVIGEFPAVPQVGFGRECGSILYPTCLFFPRYVPVWCEVCMCVCAR